MTEPIASSTLALLYLAQGHRARASTTLDEVLATDPTNGYALVLAARMQRRPRAELRARFMATSRTSVALGAGELELTWSFPRELIPPDHRVHVVFAIATREHASLRYSSIPCLDHQATQRIPAPLGPASAAIVLVASRPGAPLRLLTVADPLSY